LKTPTSDDTGAVATAQPPARLSRGQTLAVWAAVAGLLLCSAWQHRQLRQHQLHERQALYAERLRTAQIVVENEMLAAAHLTSLDPRTRERARQHLEGSPR
jgi:hypothetical protein